MKVYFGLLIIAVAMACGGNKKNAAANSEDNMGKALSTPPCILQMIDSAKGKPAHESITEIRRYVYKGAHVYLVGAPCCDQLNPVYDSACNFLFSPSGGFTGKGDRTHLDFFDEAKEDSLIWKLDK